MADFSTQPVDYGSIMGQGANLIGNPLDDQAKAAQIQYLQTQGEAAKQGLAMQQLALRRQLSFGTDLGNYVKNPTPEGLASLFGRYPEFEKQSLDARNALDRGDITQLGSAAALAAKGDYDSAAQIIQDRIDAEKKAGTDTSQSEHVLALLKSGDPAQQKGALGLLSLGVGIAVGPEKAAEFLKANGLSSEPIDVAMDHRLVNEQGQTIVGATPKLELATNTVTGESTGFNPYTGKFGANAVEGGETTAPAQTGGGGPASGGATGLQGAVATVLHNEGGLNPSDMNGAPTNFGINYKANRKELAAFGITSPGQMGNLTKEQAAQIYASKYWPQSGAEKLPANLQTPYFDVYVRNPALAKRALAQSGGDPQKFAQITSAAFQSMAQRNPKAAKYASAWANRDANNMAIATGSAPAAAAAPAQAGDPYHFGVQGVNTKEAPQNYVWNSTHTGVTPLQGSEADPNSYSPGELYDIAWTHLTTGKWGASGGGMGGGSVPQPVQKAALRIEQQIMAERGITPQQLNGIRSRTAGLSGNLNQATQMVGSLNAARENLAADGELVTEKQRALVKMGIIADHGPVGGLISNSWANNTRLDWYETHGSPEQQQAVKAYRDAVSTYAATYGKALSSANAVGGNTPSSDSARAQANELNDEGMGPTALAAHLATNLREMDNKRAGWQKQAEIAQHQLDNIIGPKGSPSGNRHPPAGATKTATGPHGQKMALVNGRWVSY